ncbi:MAG TPA: ROK family transcriptional regulator [Nocardioidaceae bacterium]|nr:ROK family transcriptional regulator [Nocardioidaceae bacterium]
MTRLETSGGAAAAGGAAVSAARPDAIRRHNLALILGHVHRDGALTRAELTARLGVSRSTIGALVADLTALGLVQESVPSGGARVGRPSHVVGPHPSGPFVVGVDVDVTHVTSAGVEIGGVVLDRRSVPIDEGPGTPETVADLVARAVTALGRSTGRAVLGVGVSVPGTVDHRSRTVGVAPNLAWREVHLGDLLTERLGPDLPVTVGNDADLAVLAELSRGNARDCDDVVYVMGRIGVGAGIVVNGVPLHGRDGRAGEIGHNVMDGNGPTCHCGKRGCLETFVGDAALLTLAGRDEVPTVENVDRVFLDARAGDERALGAVRTVAEWLGLALGSLVNTLNPQRVILGGSLSQVLGLARPEIEQALERYAFDPGHPVELGLPRFGVDSALLGAAELAFAELLDDPFSVQSLPAWP